jgi:hypothetical protein
MQHLICQKALEAAAAAVAAVAEEAASAVEEAAAGLAAHSSLTHQPM